MVCCSRIQPEIENYLYCEFLTNDIEYYDLRDGQQPTINLYSVPDDAIYEQWDPLVNFRTLIKTFRRKGMKTVEELKSLKDTLFACKGQDCKKEMAYAPTTRRYPKVCNKRQLAKHNRHKNGRCRRGDRLNASNRPKHRVSSNRLSSKNEVIVFEIY